MSDAARRRWISSPFLWRGLAAAYALAAVSFSVWRMMRDRLPYPLGDAIDIDLFISKYFLPLTPVWLAFRFPHNEHRPVFPLYLWTADHLAFASEGLSILILNALLLAGVAILIACWMRGEGSLNTRRIVLIAAAPVLIFWPGHWENLYWSVQVNFILSMAGLFAGVQLILLAEGAAIDRPRRALLLSGAAGVCVFVATFSLTFGLLGWPLLLLYLLCRRASWRAIVPFAVVGVGAVWQYAATWTRIPWHADPVESLLQPLAVGKMLLGLLGAPLHHLIDTPLWHPPHGLRIAAGAIVGVAVLTAAVRVFFSRGVAAPTFGERAVVLTAMLGTACLGIIALSRHTFGDGQELVPRYLMFSVLAWLGALGYWLPRLRIGPRARAVGLTALPLVAVLFAGSYLFQATNMRSMATIVRIGAAPTVHGIYDPLMEPSIFPPTKERGDKLRRIAESLRVRGHRFFNEPWQAWYGKKFADLAFVPAADGRCIGYTDAATRMGSVLSMNGWAWDRNRRAPPPYILGVDADGVVRGIGFTGLRRFDLVRVFGRLQYYHAGWSLLAGTPAERLQAIPVTRDGQICAINQLAPKT